MDFWLNIRLRIRDFFRKYGIIIILAIIIISIIFSLSLALQNGYIKKGETNESANNENNANTPVIDTNEKLPEQYVEPINELIASYINYCNNKEYENAYNMLSKDFKDTYFKNLDRFKIYINSVFKTKKMYTAENYSNNKNTYIYSVKIMDDLLATGSNGQGENLTYVEDKYVIKQEDGKLKLSLNGYCGQENLDIIYEDDFMKINIIKKVMIYDKEIYSIKITNKTKYYIVLANGKEQSEVILKATGKSIQANLDDSSIIILPNETTTETINFEKYFDTNSESLQLILNAIRILPEYTGYDENVASELKKAIKLYSLNIKLKPDEE